MGIHMWLRLSRMRRFHTVTHVRSGALWMWIRGLQPVVWKRQLDVIPGIGFDPAKSDFNGQLRRVSLFLFDALLE